MIGLNLDLVPAETVTIRIISQTTPIQWLIFVRRSFPGQV